MRGRRSRRCFASVHCCRRQALRLREVLIVAAVVGGGYAFRLCPAGETLDEKCFNKIHLDFEGSQVLRWLVLFCFA